MPKFSKYDAVTTPAGIEEVLVDAGTATKRMTVSQIAKSGPGINSETLTGAKTLVSTDTGIQRLDPGGSDRDVTLPAEASSTNLTFVVENTADAASETLTIKTDAPATLGTLEPGMAAYLTCDGTTWTMRVMLPPGTVTVDGVTGNVTVGGTAAIGGPSVNNTGLTINNVAGKTNIIEAFNSLGNTAFKILNTSNHSVFSTGYSLTAPRITFDGDTNTGITRAAADAIAIVAGGVESLRITEVGGVTNVLIGTTSVLNEAKLSVDGSITGSTAEIIKASTDTLTAQECYGTIINNYGQIEENTLTLPTAEEGLNGTVVIGTAGAGAFHLKAGPNDKIYLNGTALDDGDKASLATPTVGDFFTFFTFQTGASSYDWHVISGVGTLVDGGS